MGEARKRNRRHSRRWRAATASFAIPPTITVSSRISCACATSSPAASSVRSIPAACSTATARRGWCAIPPGAIRAPACCPISALISSTPVASGSGISKTGSSSSGVHGFENRAPDHVVIHREETAAADRIGNDAADVAQPFHLRHPRRARFGAYSVAVQMGAVAIHQAHAAPAERPPAGGELDPRARRSDLGARIHAFQELCAVRERRPIWRTTSGSIACCSV